MYNKVATMEPEPKKKRVVAYLRVSTEDQKTENQIHDIYSYCQYANIEKPKLYVDEGLSGTKIRPQFEQLMADARKGLFDIVIVWRFDRAGRSTLHLLQVVEEFDALGIDFVSVTEKIDTTSSMGKLMYTILAGLAQFERNLISERTIAGLRVAKQAGKLSRPRKRRFDHEEAYRLHFEEKMTIKDVAAKMGCSYPHMQGLILKVKRGGYI